VRHLAKLLGHYRLLERLSLRDMAADIGISASTLSRIERGELMDGGTLALVLAWVMDTQAKPQAELEEEQASVGKE
jgi:transcriptional regulator with XRE-family HTH domain